MLMHLNELINDHQFQQLVKQFATGCKFHVSFCFVVIDVPSKQFNNCSCIIYPATYVPLLLVFPIACFSPLLVFPYRSFSCIPCCSSAVAMLFYPPVSMCALVMCPLIYQYTLHSVLFIYLLYTHLKLVVDNIWIWWSLTDHIVNGLWIDRGSWLVDRSLMNSYQIIPQIIG